MGAILTPEPIEFERVNHIAQEILACRGTIKFSRLRTTPFRRTLRSTSGIAVTKVGRERGSRAVLILVSRAVARKTEKEL